MDISSVYHKTLMHSFLQPHVLNLADQLPLKAEEVDSPGLFIRAASLGKWFGCEVKGKYSQNHSLVWVTPFL